MFDWLINFFDLIAINDPFEFRDPKLSVLIYFNFL